MFKAYNIQAKMTAKDPNIQCVYTCTYTRFEGIISVTMKSIEETK